MCNESQMQKRKGKSMNRILVNAIGATAVTAALFTVPITVCSRGAAKWMEGGIACQQELARGMARFIREEDISLQRFQTGFSQFDGEWLFGTYLMAGIGFSQSALEHPELQEEHAPLVKQCIEKLLTPEIRAFDKERWNEDPLEGIGGKNHHAAYLGYLNLLMGLHRSAFGDESYADLHDRITAGLVRNVALSRTALLESYPGEVYPVDNSFVIGSIGLHQRVTGEDHSDLIATWVKQARACFVDQETQLFVQSVDYSDGMPMDEPRGSGTALGLFALHYADPHLARDLYRGIRKSLAGTILGFGAVREYPRGVSGQGDIDSGPIIFGYGMSATGFSIAGARRYNDETFFRQLYATAHFCGAPSTRSGRREYISGGPLGNAILFAMLTIPRAEREKF